MWVRDSGAVQEPSSAEAPEEKGPWGWVWKMGRGREVWRRSRSRRGGASVMLEVGIRGLVTEFGLGA